MVVSPMQTQSQSPRTARTPQQIAVEIETYWPKVSPYARPYLDAMHSIQNIDGYYYADTAKSVVLYFLSNAASWKGEEARRIKAELRALVTG